MTDATRLEEAIEYRDRLMYLLEFKRGLLDWDGTVGCIFGGYHMTLSMKCVAGEFWRAIAVEEKMLLNTLQILGVSVEVAPQ